MTVCVCVCLINQDKNFVGNVIKSLLSNNSVGRHLL